MCNKCKEIDEIYKDLTLDSSDDFLVSIPTSYVAFGRFLFGIECLRFWWKLANCLAILEEREQTDSEYKDKIIKLKNRDIPECKCNKILDNENSSEVESLKLINPGTSTILKQSFGIDCIKCENKSKNEEMERQYVNPKTMNVLAFKKAARDSFYYCPMRPMTASYTSKFIDRLPLSSNNYHNNLSDIIKDTPVKHGRVLLSRTLGVLYVPLPENPEESKGFTIALPTGEKPRYNLEEFEKEKKYALKLREILTECNIKKIKPEIIVSDEVDLSENITTNRIVCSQDEVPSINFILESNVKYTSASQWTSMSDINKLKIYTNETSFTDKDATIVVLPTITLRRDIEKPEIFSRGKESTYLVQSTASLNIAITNCLYWNKNKINLGYTHDKPASEIDLLEYKDIFDTSDIGINMKLNSFVVTKEQVDSKGFDYFSFYRLLPK